MAKSHFINLRIADHKVLLWIIAILITMASAVYQRMTGPTYPVRSKVTINHTEVTFELPRSETTDKDLQIRLEVSDENIAGYIKYKRYKSNDDWTQIQMTRDGNLLTTTLPKQPAAGKLIYQVFLSNNGSTTSLTNVPVICRFKGSVPGYVLIPHILFMFLGMLYSNRSGIEALDARGDSVKYMRLAIFFFFIGGLLLGPLVQKFAFDAYWTGVPFGYDLTDNKTLIAVVGWLLAWIKNRNGRDGRGWIFFASILMLAVYLIPHSVLGSEIDYTKMPNK